MTGPSHSRRTPAVALVVALATGAALWVASPARAAGKGVPQGGAPPGRPDLPASPATPHPAVPPDPTHTPPKASAPAVVSFIGIHPGQSVPSRRTFRVRLTNFDPSSDPSPSALVPGRGFLHFSLNGGAFDLPQYSGANGTWAVQAGTQGRYSPSAAPSITYRNLPRGRYRLTVSLADNFHGELGIRSSVTFVVR